MLDNPILADRRVRQALILAVDRQAISDRLFAGKQPVAATGVHPLDWVHTTDGVPTYGYDPARAEALLEEAGWTRGPKGRSEAHTSELQSLLRNSYDVFCLNKKITTTRNRQHPRH